MPNKKHLLSFAANYQIICLLGTKKNDKLLLIQLRIKFRILWMPLLSFIIKMEYI